MDGTKVRRYQCVTPALELTVTTSLPRGPKPKNGRKTAAAETETIYLGVEKHTFSVCVDEEPLPKFAPVKCVEHPGSRVMRKGTNNSKGTRHQRYLCRPANEDEEHRFTLPLPRTAVEQDPKWSTSDAVKNPHRGATASGRGQTATTETVAEGLQQLSMGNSYAQVGKWARSQRPMRVKHPKPMEEPESKKKSSVVVKVAATKKKNLRTNYWQTGADWVEMFSPVLWNAWQEELSKEPAPTLPRVLVLDDIPFYAGAAPSGRSNSAMVFSALVATEYYQAAPDSSRYRQRVRLVRAYPTHNGDAYELLVLESGVVPDVIVSDSSTSILAMVARLKKQNPNLVWVPSAFHVSKQLMKALGKMRWGKPARHFVPGDLLESLEDFSFLNSPEDWRSWWHDLGARCLAQGVPADKFPTHWRGKYYDKIADALDYLVVHPGVPRGTGAVEASIRGQVKPFFEPRAAAFTNIERINRLADLLTLRMNDRMDNRAAIAATLRRDAESAGGYVPPARSITERKGAQLLRDPLVLPASLAAMRKQARTKAAT